MAIIESQKKRIHRSERERLENLRFKSAVKTHFHRLEAAVEAGDRKTAEKEHGLLVGKIDKATKTRAIHKNNASRKKSRAARILASAG